MSKEYRTDEQWQELCENAANGNWADAAQNCVDGGFYANDMIKKYNQEDYHILEDTTDLAILAEMATEIRGQ